MVNVDYRIKINDLSSAQPFLRAEASRIHEQESDGIETTRLTKIVSSSLYRYLQSRPSDTSIRAFENTISAFSTEDRESLLESALHRVNSSHRSLTDLANIDELNRGVDKISSLLPLKLEQKQKILELADIEERASYLVKLLDEGPNHYSELVKAAEPESRNATVLSAGGKSIIGLTIKDKADLRRSHPSKGILRIQEFAHPAGKFRLMRDDNVFLLLTLFDKQFPLNGTIDSVGDNWDVNVQFSSDAKYEKVERAIATYLGK